MYSYVHVCMRAYMCVCVHLHVYACMYNYVRTVIWLYFALKKFRTLLFRAVLISYAPHIIYEARVKVSLLKNICEFNFRMDGSVGK